MLGPIALLVLGLVLLFAGGEFLVRGAVSLANRLGLSPSIIGLTVVGFGTSTPELLVSVSAALAGSADIAVGNVVGSNIANILLILGVAAVISPMAIRMAQMRRDLVVMLGAALVALALGLAGGVGRLAGAAMVAALLAYIGYAAITDRRKGVGDGDPIIAVPLPAWQEAAAIVGGLVALMIGADLLIDTASALALAFGASEAVIGLTIIAVGTSLPELATSVVAALRRHADIAIGNVVGSNIFNIVGILGVTALVRPIDIEPCMARFDIPLMIGVSLVLVAIAAGWQWIGRATGAAFLAAYAAYIAALF